MKQLTADILIEGIRGNIRFDYTANIEIAEGIDIITSTASLIFPKKISWSGNNILDFIGVGNQITIKIGYDYEMPVVFAGYISKIHNSVPIKIECEDQMYQLKQEMFSESYEQVTLKKLLQDMLPSGVGFIAEDINLGSVRVNNSNVAKVLDYLKQHYGIYSFFRNGSLYSQFVVSDNYSEFQKTHKFKFGVNIINRDDLVFSTDTDTKLLVKAYSINEDNIKIESEVGDQDGDVRTLHFQNLTKEELKQYAEKELGRLKYTGYKGSFLAFGYPMVQKGDLVQFIDDSEPNRSGWSYLVKNVKKTFGFSGYRQTIEIANKI